MYVQQPGTLLPLPHGTPLAFVLVNLNFSMARKGQAPTPSALHRKHEGAGTKAFKGIHDRTQENEEGSDECIESPWREEKERSSTSSTDFIDTTFPAPSSASTEISLYHLVVVVSDCLLQSSQLQAHMQSSNLRWVKERISIVTINYALCIGIFLVAIYCTIIDQLHLWDPDDCLQFSEYRWGLRFVKSQKRGWEMR
ncbi:hypothetical protein F5877DRAFT_70737 [Lentinula edodes]|nr:hypothetical protein F5877DRAFT_70737 [Lentinula edodes]